MLHNFAARLAVELLGACEQCAADLQRGAVGIRLMKGTVDDA